MSRARVFVVVAVVVFLSAVTILATERIDDEAPPLATSTTTFSAATTTTTTTTSTTTTTTTTTTVPPVDEAIDDLIAAMTLEQKAAQLVVAGAAGPDVAGSIADATGTTCLGGVFVSRNVGNWAPADDLEAATAAIGLISSAAADCPARPFITTDAEPGTRVLKVPVPPLPDPATLVANHEADPGTTSEGLAPAATAFATALADAGVHANLGVIADVDVGPEFYMARQRRSLGGDPVAVTAITEAIVEGHCAAGVAPTLKHFPNQGSTLEDPHELDSVSVNGQSAWSEFGRIPYADSRAPLIMTGHIRYEGIDGGLPATLSAVITTGWLRNGLNYRGVIITDDLHGMRGVTAELPASARGAAAIAAGADLALYVAADDLGSVISTIVDRAEADPAFALRVDESVRRVLTLKGALGLVEAIDPAWLELCG